jgi:hypothetical protein
MSSFYTTDCGLMKYVLHVRVHWTTRVTFGYGIILMLSTNVNINSASTWRFGMVLSETLSWAPVCYLTCWLFNDSVVFWKLCYGRCVTSGEVKVAVSAPQSSSTQWGWYIAVVEHDVSYCNYEVSTVWSFDTLHIWRCVSQQLTTYNVFDLFLTRNLMMETLCANLFHSVYIHAHVKGKNQIHE